MTRVDQESAAVRAHCESVGYTFKPWEPCPWETTTHDPPEYARGSAWAGAWPKICRLRQKILDELRGGGAKGEDA